MKTKLIAAVMGSLISLAQPGRAATNDLSAALQRGLFEEEANHNLDAAIQAYQSVVNQYDKDRKQAATAIFRLGESYRKQGKTNEAGAQYERVVREFGDQPELLMLSRQNLSALGNRYPRTPASSSEVARREQKRLYEEEIKLAEKQLAQQQEMAKLGRVSQGEIMSTERDLLKLKRQLAAFEAGQTLSELANE